MMDGSSIAFYGIATFVLATALLAVTATKIFRAAIWLLFSLIGIAGLYFWMQVEFVAAVQIIVYVGGIVVLIIFSIFLTQQSETMPRPTIGRMIFSGLAALFGLAFTFNLIFQHSFPVPSTQAFLVSPEAIGTAMLSTTNYGYVLPFEVVSILLLASMIGCIVIAMKVPAAQQQSNATALQTHFPEEPTPPVSNVLIPSTTEKEEVDQ